MAGHRYWVYILASARNGTLYTGVSSNLIARVQQHRAGLIPGFTRDYGVKRLVWYEEFAQVDDAIRAEKRIKKWRRGWKLELIEMFNPDWEDLWSLLISQSHILHPLGPRVRGDDKLIDAKQPPPGA